MVVGDMAQVFLMIDIVLIGILTTVGIKNYRN